MGIIGPHGPAAVLRDASLRGEPGRWHQRWVRPCHSVGCSFVLWCGDVLHVGGNWQDQGLTEGSLLRWAPVRFGRADQCIPVIRWISSSEHFLEHRIRHPITHNYPSRMACMTATETATSRNPSHRVFAPGSPSCFLPRNPPSCAINRITSPSFGTPLGGALRLSA